MLADDLQGSRDVKPQELVIWKAQCPDTQRWEVYPRFVSEGIEKVYRQRSSDVTSVAWVLNGNTHSIDFKTMVESNQDGRQRKVIREQGRGEDRAASGTASPIQATSLSRSGLEEQTALQEVHAKAEEARVKAVEDVLRKVREEAQLKQQTAVEDAVRAGIVQWSLEGSDWFTANTRRWCLLSALIMLFVIVCSFVILASDLGALHAETEDSFEAMRALRSGDVVDYVVSRLKDAKTPVGVCLTASTLWTLSGNSSQVREAVYHHAELCNLLLQAIRDYNHQGVKDHSTGLLWTLVSDSAECKKVLTSGADTLRESTETLPQESLAAQCTTAILSIIAAEGTDQSNPAGVCGSPQNASPCSLAEDRNCPNNAWSVILILLFFVCVVSFVAVIVYVVSDTNRNYGKLNAEGRQTPHVLKVLCTHLQLLCNVLQVALPMAALQTFLGPVHRVINIDIDFRSFNCIFDPAHHASILFYFICPIVAALGLMSGFGLLWRRNEGLGKPTFWREKVISSIIVFAFIFWPTAIKHFLVVVSCSTCSFPLRAATLFFGGCYTIIPPLCLFFVLNNRRKQQLLASRACLNAMGFLYRGYRPSRWYWEGTVYLRKVAVAAILAVTKAEPMVQSLCLFWVIGTALVLHISFNPHTYNVVNRLEALSLSIVFITLCVSVMCSYLSSPAMVILLTILLFVINVICVALFVALFLHEYTKRPNETKRWVKLGKLWESVEQGLLKSLSSKLAVINTRASRAEQKAKDHDIYLSDMNQAIRSSASLTVGGVGPIEQDAAVTAAWHHIKARKMSGQRQAHTALHEGSESAKPVSEELQPNVRPQAPNIATVPDTPPDPEDPDTPRDDVISPNATSPRDGSGSVYSSVTLGLEREKEVPLAMDKPPFDSASPHATSSASSTVIPGIQTLPAPQLDTEASQEDPQAPKRVGLRAPHNEERTRIPLLEDFSNQSSQSIYLYYCKMYEVRPKEAVRKELPDTINDFSMERLILHESMLIGNKGLLPILEVVRQNQKLKSLSAAGNGIKNSGVEWLVHMALDHPCLTSIDLHDNRITSAAATLLCYLAHRNPRILAVNIEGTKIDPSLKGHLEERLRQNKSSVVLDFGTIQGHGKAS